MLASRLAAVTDWVAAQPATRDLHIGYFGASTGAAAALVAAAMRPQLVRAVVSRGGRPDLAGADCGRVHGADAAHRGEPRRPRWSSSTRSLDGQ